MIISYAMRAAFSKYGNISMKTSKNGWMTGFIQKMNKAVIFDNTNEHAHQIELICRVGGE